jgi:hypothetical protein
MINLRFGPNTWKEILEERARRIQEQKEHERLQRVAKIKADKEMWADIKMVLKVAGIVFIALAIAIGSVWYSRLP